MEAHKKKMTLLVTEINRMAEENRKLNSSLRRMITNYEDLQKQTKRVDGSQIFSPENRSEDNFNFRILSRRSDNTDFSAAVSHHPSDSHEQVGDKDGKNTIFMDDQQRPSHKRKINHLQLDQFQNRMINPSMEEPPTKKHQRLSNVSCEQTAPVTKKIVSVRTRSEAAVEFIGIASLIASFCTMKASQGFFTVLNPNMQLKNHFNCNKSRFNLNFFRRIPSPESPKSRIIDNSIN